MNPAISEHHAADVPMTTNDKGLNLLLELLRRAIFKEDEKPLLAQWNALKAAEKKAGVSWLK